MAERRNKFEDIGTSLLKELKSATEVAETSRRTRGRTATAEAREEETAERPNLANNFFFKTMKDEGLTEKKKITLIRDKIGLTVADPLAQKDTDLKAANDIFASFEAYYTNLQDDAIDTDMQSIRELMDRIKNSIAPKMKEMIDSLTGTNTSIKECRDLLDVLKAARLLGKTIEELQAGVQRNAQLEKEIETKKQDVAKLETEKKIHEERVDAASKAINEQGSTALGGITQSLFGVPKGLKAALEQAQKSQLANATSLSTLNAQIENLDSQRQKELDEGPLRILRSFDMTQNGLKDQIEKTAQNVIDVVNTVRSSVRVLLERVNKSEEAMSGIVREIGNTRIDRTMLISSLSEAYQTNQGRSDKIGEEVSRLENELAAANEKEKDGAESAQIQVDLITQGTNHSQSLAYGERINRLLQSMRTSDATSVLATNDAERITESVKNNKEGLNALYNHTLPAVSTAMKLVLHQFVDEQDQEFRMAIGEVTKNLGATAEGTAERALEQQKLFQEQKVAGLKTLIGQLDRASDLLSRSIEQSVKGAISEEAALTDLTDAAGNLRQGVTRASEVASEVRTHVRKAKVAANDSLSSDGASGGPVTPKGAVPMAMRLG